jgi:hypothetical protein
MNILLLKEFESNGEIIKLQVTQTDKGISVDIEGKTMDVYINGEEYYSKFDNPLYAHIPTNLRSFVEKNNGSNKMEKHTGFIRTYLQLGKEEYSVEIPTKRAKSNDIIIRNSLYSYEEISEEIKEVPYGRENFEMFLDHVKLFGYNFVFSHSAQDYYNYWQLLVPINLFDESKVNNCIELWEEYNDKLEKYLDKE